MLHLRTICELIGFTVVATLRCDNVAARGIAQRQGVAKVRGLEVNTFWLQDTVKAKGMAITSVTSHETLAGLGTKIMPESRLRWLRRARHRRAR